MTRSCSPSPRAASLRLKPRALPAVPPPFQAPPRPRDGHPTPASEEKLMRIVSAAIVAALLAVSPASAQTMQKSLYERLGGMDAIRAVVDDFVGNVAADKRINKFFANTDITRLKTNLVNQICQGTGG